MQNVKFMSAVEKELVLKHWKRFMGGLDGYDFTEESQLRLQKLFPRMLYEHLINHCSFIAHYNQCGFFQTYFTDPSDTIRFLEQFGKQPYTSIEYGDNYWETGDYADINTEMCNVTTPLFEKLRSRFSDFAKQKDLNNAAVIAHKHGYTLIKQ